MGIKHLSVMVWICDQCGAWERGVWNDRERWRNLKRLGWRHIPTGERDHRDQPITKVLCHRCSGQTDYEFSGNGREGRVRKHP